MGRVVIVEHRQDRLAAEIMKVVDDAVVSTNFKLTLQAGDVLCWLPLPNEPVDDEVQDMVTMVDQNIFPPAKIVMLSIPGTADDADQAHIKQWFGAKGWQWVMAHQYAVKMIDELELPYTIVRAVPLTDQSTAQVVVPEEQALTGDHVGIDQVAQVLKTALTTDRYRNQSIGVTDK